MRRGERSVTSMRVQDKVDFNNWRFCLHNIENRLLSRGKTRERNGKNRKRLVRIFETVLMMRRSRVTRVAMFGRSDFGGDSWTVKVMRPVDGMEEPQKLFRLPGTIEEEEERETDAQSTRNENPPRAESPLLVQKIGGHVSGMPRNITLVRVSTQSSSIGGVGRQDSYRYVTKMFSQYNNSYIFVQFLLKIWFVQNFSASQYNENLESHSYSKYQEYWFCIIIIPKSY